MQLAELQRDYRDFILALASEHGLSDIRVFGSVARGEAKPGSDLDMLVKIAPKVSLLDVIGFELEVGKHIGIPVQTVDDECIHPLLKEGILHDAVPL